VYIVTRFDVDDDEMFTKHTSRSAAMLDFVGKIGQKELLKSTAEDSDELEYFNSAKIHLLKINQLIKEEDIAKDIIPLLKDFNQKKLKLFDKIAKEKIKSLPGPKIWLIKHGKISDSDCKTE
jgi:hypothetical protein